MCKDCWLDDGAPKINTLAVRGATSAIAEVYGFNAAGGALHVIVDDYNIDFRATDPFWQQQIDLLSESNEERFAYQRCFDLLSALSEAERMSAVALYWGDWSPNPEGAVRRLAE